MQNVNNYINVVAIKWGTLYSYQDVNRLYKMIVNNTKYKINFFCFTENIDNLDENIITKPLPKMNMDSEKLKYAYQKEAGLCDDNLGNLNGQRVFFFDLDIVILKNIDCLFEYSNNDNKFYIIKDWCFSNGKVGNASCYSWQVGTLGYIKEYFEKNSDKVIKKYYTASQEYLSAKIIEKYGKLNFFPEHWVCSFKNHCLSVWYLRYFVKPKLPNKGEIILVFHGDPKIDNAIAGKWSDKEEPFYKIIYKKNLSAEWIKNYIK